MTLKRCSIKPWDEKIQAVEEEEAAEEVVEEEVEEEVAVEEAEVETHPSPNKLSSLAKTKG